MSMPDPSKCFATPGRLFIGVSDGGLAAAVPPFGGSYLGIKSGFKVVREQAYAYKHSEARGRNKVGVYGGQYACAIVFIAEQVDPDYRHKVWAYSTSSPNGYASADILTLPKAGQTTVPTGNIVPTAPVLFAPDDVDRDGVLIFAPIWTLETKAELDKVIDKPEKTSFVVVVGIDANGNDLRMAPVYNLKVSA